MVIQFHKYYITYNMIVIIHDYIIILFFIKYIFYFYKIITDLVSKTDFIKNIKKHNIIKHYTFYYI